MFTVQLIGNVGLLLALSLFYDWIVRNVSRDSRLVRLALGFLFGGVAVLGMLAAMHLREGIFFDGRTIVLSLAGLFGGGEAAGVAAAIALAYRIPAGGAGMWMGAGTICTSAALGVAFRLWFRNIRRELGLWKLLLLGFSVHTAMLLWMYALPPEDVETALWGMGVPVLTVFPAATVALGLMLKKSDDHLAVEDEVRRQRDLFERIATIGPVGIVLLDAEGRFIFANPPAEDILTLGRGHLVGRGHSELVWRTADGEGAVCTDEEVFFNLVRDSGEPVHGLRYSLARADGSRTLLHVGASPVFGTGGAFDGAVAVFEDFTEQEASQLEADNANRALQESELRLRSLVGSMLDMVFLFDEEGRFTFTNLGGQKRAVWAEPGFFLGRKPGDVMPPEVDALFQRAFAQVRGGSSATYDYALDMEGGRRWFSARLTPMTVGGQFSGAVCVARDVTERLAAEERFRQLFATMSSGVVVYEAADGGLDFVLKDMNPAMERIARLSRSDALGKRLMELFPNAEKAGMLGALRDVWRSGQMRELPRHKYLDERLDLWVVSRLYRLPSGEVVGVLDDVSEENRLQEEVRQAQRLEAVGLLAGGVAHEFNNVLMGISGYAHLLLQADGTDEKAREDLREILHLADRAADLTRGLLAFGRKQRLERKAMDVNAICKSLGRIFDKVIGEDIDVWFDLAEPPPRANADPGQVEQVLMNLVLNARDAMPEGGRLIVATKPVRLESNFSPEPGFVPGEFVELSVRDTGTGMDEETLERLFEPFFTTKDVGQGSGLGLPTAYGIVKQHGGDIRVESAPGQGSMFRVYLPAAKQADGAAAEAAPPPAAQAANAAPAPAKDGRGVLVVDDEPVVRTVVARCLQARGWSVSQADSVESALAVLREQGEAIGLVVTDVVMPGASGWDLHQAARAQRSDLPFLFISGYSEDVPRVRQLADSGVDIVPKPFEAEELARRAEELMRG